MGCIFTPTVALSSQNVADLVKRGGTSGGVARRKNVASSANFSYEDSEKRDEYEPLRQSHTWKTNAVD